MAIVLEVAAGILLGTAILMMVCYGVFDGGDRHGHSVPCDARRRHAGRTKAPPKNKHLAQRCSCLNNLSAL